MEGGEEPAIEEPMEGGAEPAAETPMESHNKKGDLLVETEMKKRKLDNRTKKYQNIYTNRLMESLERKGLGVSMEHIEKNKDSLTEDLKKMSDNIDELTKD
jgi:hypothetical protein